MKEWNVGLMSHLGMRFVEVGPGQGGRGARPARRARDDRRRGPRRHADGARRYGRRGGHRVDGVAHGDARIEDQLRRRHGRKAARGVDRPAQGQTHARVADRVTDERGKLLSLTIQTQMIL